MKYDYLRKHRLFDGPGPDNLENIKKRIQELHDSYHPQAIFMTQTSAPLFGWMIKEMYKTAWTDEKVPTIFTLNVRDASQNQDLPHARDMSTINTDSYGFNRLKKVVKSKLTGHDIKGNVAIIDERSSFYSDKSYEDKKFTPVFEPNPNSRVGEKGYWNRGLSNPKTLAYSLRVVNEALKEMGNKSKVAVLGLGEQRLEGAPWYRKVGEGYEKVHRLSKDERRGLEAEPAEVRDILHPKYAIKRYKGFGRELGEQIKAEREAKKKGLEGTLGIISIAGFLFSILFLSGITGNVIGATETKSLIGIISILIGLIAGFFYIKIRKKPISERFK